MIPVGYLYKKVERAPAQLNAEAVEDIYSLSGCISRNFADYMDYWKHNGYWLFDSPEIMQEIARVEGIDLSEMSLFYYEVYPLEFEEEARKWIPSAPELSFKTSVQIPASKHLEGFDVTTFQCNTTPECSPLSCNSLAAKTSVNEHCLFRTFEEAKKALDEGFFLHGEPGPLRIFAVYTMPPTENIH